MVYVFITFPRLVHVAIKKNSTMQNIYIEIDYTFESTLGIRGIVNHESWI